MQKNVYINLKWKFVVTLKSFLNSKLFSDTKIALNLLPLQKNLKSLGIWEESVMTKSVLAISFTKRKEKSCKNWRLIYGEPRIFF